MFEQNFNKDNILRKNHLALAGALFLIFSFFVELSFGQNIPNEQSKTAAAPTPNFSQKSTAARRILLAYKYPPMLNQAIKDILKNYPNNKVVGTVEFKTKLLNLAFNTAVADLAEKFTEAELIKIADIFSGPDGQLMIIFIDKFFQSPHLKAIAAIKQAVQAEAKKTSPLNPTTIPAPPAAKSQELNTVGKPTPTSVYNK